MDEREIEAATDALLEDSGLPRYGGHRATVERRMRIAFEAANRVRDARGDDEAGRKAAEASVKRSLSYKLGPRSVAEHAINAYLAARSSQGEDHEDTVGRIVRFLVDAGCDAAAAMVEIEFGRPPVG